MLCQILETSILFMSSWKHPVSFIVASSITFMNSLRKSEASIIFSVRIDDCYSSVKNCNSSSKLSSVPSLNAALHRMLGGSHSTIGQEGEVFSDSMTSLQNTS